MPICDHWNVAALSGSHLILTFNLISKRAPERETTRNQVGRRRLSRAEGHFGPATIRLYPASGGASSETIMNMLMLLLLFAHSAETGQIGHDRYGSSVSPGVPTATLNRQPETTPRPQAGSLNPGVLR
jgi:hypothetical protein